MVNKLIYIKILHINHAYIGDIFTARKTEWVTNLRCNYDRKVTILWSIVTLKKNTD